MRFDICIDGPQRWALWSPARRFARGARPKKTEDAPARTGALRYSNGYPARRQACFSGCAISFEACGAAHRVLACAPQACIRAAPRVLANVMSTQFFGSFEPLVSE